MYYEYLHQEGMFTEWLTCQIVDPMVDDGKLLIRFKLGHEEYEESVTANRIRLVTNNLEISQ
jgi:hypothetical protein